MAITVGNITPHSAATGSSATFAHNNDGDYLVVGVMSWVTDAGANPTGVTYNGVAMTPLGASAYGASVGATLWGLVAPAAGSNNVVVSWGSGSSNPRAAGAISFSGVDQTTPTGTADSFTSNASSAPSTTVSSATGELVVDVVAIYQVSGTATTATVGASQDERVNQDLGTAARKVLMSTEPGAASVTMSWALSQTCRARAVSIPLLPASAAAVTGTATLALLFGLAASAVAPVTAAASLPLTMGVTATAEAPVTGASTLPLTFSLASAATSTIAASATLPLSLALTGTGEAPVTGAATLGLLFGVSGTATASVEATASLPLVLGFTATGVLGNTITGTAALAFTLDLTGTATTPIGGAATLPLTLALTAQGAASVQATAVMALTLAAMGTATSTVSGVATLPFTLALTATGAGPLTGPTFIQVTAISFAVPRATDVALSFPRATAVTLTS